MIPAPMMMDSARERARELEQLGAPPGRPWRLRHRPGGKLRLATGQLLMRLGAALVDTPREPACAP
jgi:hypothetical protein